MKKLICFLLAIVMTVSLSIPVFAEESEEPQYGTIKVEYSDARGTIENLDVMVLNGYVYAHMASFCERLGYRWDQKDGLVTIDVVAGIWYDEAPALALHFRPGDTTVSYNPLCGIEIEYDAPAPFIENDRGIWVPLQYTLTLLGGSRNIAGDILVIQMPTANVLSVAAMIMNSGGVLSFDWVDDFGYSETATNVTDGAARVVTLFEGLLSFDGSAWTSFVDWNAFDKKFGKTLAALMCTYSSDELKDSIEEVEVMLDVFADDGALGSMLRTQETLIDSDVNAWEKICEEKLAQLKAGCGTLPQYNMAYQQYERATKKQDLFSAVGADEIISIQDGLADATNALEWAKRIGYGVTYMAEFQQRDDFQATVLKNYFATRKDTDKLDNAAAKAIADYASSNIIEYTASKFFEEHALEILVDESGLDALMGVPANLLLLAWDIMSETIPFYSEGLDSVENREISNYAQQIQNDAYQNLNTLIASLRADTASISPEDCVQLAEYCYVYLKSCYIARSFAIESLEGISEETYKKLESKINVETDANHRIVKYLSIIGQADLENSCLILGFLPKNNKDLLEMYSDADLVAIVQQYPEIDYDNLVTDAYFDYVFDEYDCYCYHIPKFTLSGNGFDQLNSEIYNKMYPILQAGVYNGIGIYTVNMSYGLGLKGNYASLIVSSAISAAGAQEFDVYNIDIRDCSRISESSLLASYGLTTEKYRDLVKKALIEKFEFENNDTYEANKSKESYRNFYQQQRNATISDENMDAVIPYIDVNGDLCVVAFVFSMTDAEGYYHLINIMGTTNPDPIWCQIDHGADSRIPTNDVLQYFIENCDRRYFTEDEIQGFDETMCMYARNAIYAKSGRIFSTEELSNYFQQFSWYTPSIPSDMFTEDMLNPYQITNRNLIVNHEKMLKEDHPDALQTFIENCDRRYFSAADISSFDEEDFLYARNAIYAKSGWIFSNQKLASYFQKYSWYTPTLTSDEFTEDMLNPYQIANRDLIVALENNVGGISAEQAYSIACKYWDYQEGDIAEETGFELYLIEDGTIENNGIMYYCFRLRWLVNDGDGHSWLSTVDYLYINAKTGECSYTYS